MKENGREELLLRVAALHGHYLEAARRQGYTPLGVGTMRSYLKKHSGFIEERSYVRFSEITSGSTSCYAFDCYKIRQQGIEFSTTTLLADVAGKPIHFNGNLPELLADLMATITPSTDYRDGAVLLATFNRDKSPAATLEAFRAGTNGKTYFGEGTARSDVEARPSRRHQGSRRSPFFCNVLIIKSVEARKRGNVIYGYLSIPIIIP